VANLAQLVEAGEAGDPSGAEALKLVQRDPWLTRAVARERELAPLLRADETELLLVGAEAEALDRLNRSLRTRGGEVALGREMALVRARRDGLDAATRGMGKAAQEAAAARHCFQLYDLDASGAIAAEELGGLLRSLRVPCREEEVVLLLKQMDADGSGEVDFDEFNNWYLGEGLGRRRRAALGLRPATARRQAREAAGEAGVAQEALTPLKVKKGAKGRLFG